MPKADIYLDEQGRRRVNRSPSMGAPPVEQQNAERLYALEQKLATVTAQLAAAEARAAELEGPPRRDDDHRW